MKKLIYVIILFLSACGSIPEFEEVMINKSVKVYSKEYHDKAENYTFKWEPPVDPNNQPVSFDLKNDMLIFSPNIEGNYQIHLSITDISDEVISEEMFYYRAVAETLGASIVKPKVNNKHSEQSTVVKKPQNKSPYNTKKTKTKKRPKGTTKQNNSINNKENIYLTIQISASQSLEQARTDQLQLIEEGIDAYIQRYYQEAKDEVWYRVRVGNFSNKEKALGIQQHIDIITNKKSWLDEIPKEKR